MAIVKASYTRKAGTAKAHVRYIENRPGKDGARYQRTLFKADGKVERGAAYTMIDQAAKGSYFFRFIISPDPQSEDRDKALLLRELAEQTIQSLEARFRQHLEWAATIHADHTDNRHIHALAILPERLSRQDLQQMKSAATDAALEQRHQLELAREQRELIHEVSEGLGLELAW